MKRIGLVGLLLLLGTQAALSSCGEINALKVLGFSPDGRYFAFQEAVSFDWDDPSACAKTTTAIEVENDRLVRGTPVRASLPTDQKKEADILSRSSAMLKRLGIKTGSDGIQVVEEEDKRLRADFETFRASDFKQFPLNAKTLPLPQNWFGRDAQLVLEPFKARASHCRSVANPDPASLKLTLELKNSRKIDLKRDKALPASRGCPFSYGFAEVHALRLENGDVAFAVVVQYLAPGGEIPDRRFIAVTARVPRL
jgi:predicted secreted protein